MWVSYFIGYYTPHHSHANLKWQLKIKLVGSRGEASSFGGIGLGDRMWGLNDLSKENIYMKTYLTLAMTVLGILVSSGCSGDKLAGDIKIDWDGDRSYKAIVKDDDGTERVQLDCQYVGKGPEQPMKTPIDRDWKVSDTDFYHIEITTQDANKTKLEAVV